MQVLRLNTVLFVLGSLLWYMAAGLFLYAAMGKVQVEPTKSEPVRPTGPKESVTKTTDLPPLSAFAGVWHTPLQRAVFDAPPPPSLPEVKPDPPKLKALLMATTVDRGVPKAMLKLPSGKYATLSVGETFDNNPGTAKIVGIDGRQVTLQFEGFEEQITIGIK